MPSRGNDFLRANALVGWMFHGRAYAGGRFVFLYNNADLGTP